MSRIQIGKITGAHGIKGEVKVLSLAADAGLLFRDAGVFTAAEDGLTLQLTARPEAKPGLFISKIDGVTDRTAAEHYTNTALYIDRDDLPETDDDEFYLSDLEGLDAVTPEGKKLGTITGVQNFGASDLADITGPDGKNFYIPLADPFLIEVDFDENKVVMIEPEVMT
jgi:16S rRNA processing protein RimM